VTRTTRLTNQVTLQSPTGSVRTYSPSEYSDNVAVYQVGPDGAQVEGTPRTMTTAAAIHSIEARVGKLDWTVDSAGPELARLRRNFRARMARKARDEVASSIGLVKVRDSVSGRIYYE
jgi:hypothetical protein